MAFFALYWKPLALMALVVGALGWGGVQKQRGAALGRAEVQVQWNASRAIAADAAASATAGFRASEQAMQTKVKEAEDAKRIADSRRARAVADAAAARAGLHSDVANFAGGRGTADDSLIACIGRANAIGGLLDKALLTSEHCAADGERDADIARGLLAAWPTTTKGVKP